MFGDKQKNILSVARNYKRLLLLYFFVLVSATMFESIGLGMLLPIFQTIQGIETNHVLAVHAKWGLGIIGLEYSFTNLITLFTIATLVKYALLAISTHLGRVLSSSVTCDMREKVFRNLMNLPLSYFYQKKTGDLVAVQFTSAQNAGAIFEYMMLIINSIFFCVLYLAMNLMVSFSLTVLVMGLFSISYLFLLPRFQKGYLKGEEESRGMEGINSYLHDVFSGVKTVKVFGNAARHGEHYGSRANDYRRVSVQIMDNKIIASLFYEPLLFLFMVVCLVFAVAFLEIPFAILAVFLVICLHVLPKLKVINHYWLVVNEFAPHLARVQGYAESGNREYPPEGRAPVGDLKKGVRFENVSFAYPGSRGDALSGISASVGKCETTALVGSSGSGKTTFVDLFLRLHEPTRGAIYVDDVDLRDVSTDEWRSLIGVVEQDPYLFNDTVYNNILYGNPEADEAQARKAAETAYAHEYIEALPEGYRTVIGNRGFRLSGGQKQRLALARALVRSPRILVLDEATSSLDSEFERLIQTAVQNLAGRATILVVAHRLSTIKDANKILVFENGRIVQVGSHASLMREEGRYKEFLTLQA